jgi:S1-C subfamily serine protease
MSLIFGEALRLRGIALTIVLAVFASDGVILNAQAKGADEGNTVRVYKRVAPAIVFIKCSLTNDYLTNGVSGSIGSGIVVDPQGLIVTNAHVVEGAAKIQVILHDGAQLSASLLGSDPFSDLALLRVDLPNRPLPAVLLGNSDRIEIGQEVVAIGHPFGLGYALTTGVVSGFGGTPDPRAPPQERVIQTSAAINPGNSGGPLVDKDGFVIGINTAIMTGGQNIGFAIPINTAKSVVHELRTHGRVIRPWLGVTGKFLSDEVINIFAFPLARGFLVARIEEGSPAQKAGLRAGTLNVVVEGEPWVLGGDIVLAVNGRPVRTAQQFLAMVKTLEIGQTVTLQILRGGALQEMAVSVEEHRQPLAGSSQTRGREGLGFLPMQRHKGPGEWQPREVRF